MNNTPLVESEKMFSNQYRALLEFQKGIMCNLKDYEFDLSKREITDAVMTRMGAFWDFHMANNKMLARHSTTAADEFFTETCLLYIKCYLERRFEGKGILVESEKTFYFSGQKRTGISPDISVTLKDELLAVIELKVNDGWKGKSMKQHLIERQEQIRQINPDCIFSVLAYWDFLGDDTAGFEETYYYFDKFKVIEKHIPTPKTVEMMLERIVAKINIRLA